MSPTMVVRWGSILLSDPKCIMGLGGEDATQALSQVLAQIQPLASCALVRLG